MNYLVKNLSFGLAALTGISSASALVLSDFDGNGIPYVVGTVEGTGAVGILTGGPTGSYYQILDNTNSQRPFIAFDSDEGDPDDDFSGWTEITFTMDFRADNVNADGFGINFLDTSVHGHTGGVAYLDANNVQGAEERAPIPDSLGLGFRTYQATNATVSYDRVDLSGDTPYTLPQGSWASLAITVVRNRITREAVVSATMYSERDQTGTASEVFTDFAVPDVTFEDFRVQIGARTGGEAMTLELDNIEMEVLIPEILDTDGDGLPDDWEVFYSLGADDNGLDPNNNGVTGDPENGAAGDPDSDGLTNLEELDLGTDPTDEDTDDDGFTDGVEDGGGTFVDQNQTGTDPLVADTDEDGLLDGVEIPTEPFVDATQTGTDPNEFDTDEDGFGDGLEIELGRNPAGVDTPNPTTGIVADFDGNGEAFVDAAFRSANKGQLIPEDDRSDGNYYRLLSNVGDAGNYIAFESDADYSDWETFSFQMDYLAENVDADGFGINFLSENAHGEAGVAQVLDVEERALIDNSFGVGFRTFQATNATVTWNGADLSGDAPYTLTTGNWASLGIDVERDPDTKDATVDVFVYDQPDRQGNEESVFSDFAIPAMDLEDFRVQVSGRTGGSAMDLSIDNLKLFVDGLVAQEGIEISAINTQVVPGEPATISVTITWNSRPGQSFAILANDNLEDDFLLWNELEDSFNAAPGAESTSYTETGIPLGTTRRFYVVELTE